MRAFLLTSVALAGLVIAPSLTMAQMGAEHGDGDHAGAQHGGVEHAPAGGGHEGGAAPMQHMQSGETGHMQGAPKAAGPGSDHEKMSGEARKPDAAEPDDNHMQRAGAAATHGDAKSAHISGDQRSRMIGAFHGMHAERIPRADFAVHIGGMVPRHYHYYPLPPEIVEIVPEYEGYDYVEVGDEILILDPDTGEIVYVID